MKKKDFPNFFRASDKASQDAQSTYVNYVKWDLILMVFASILAIYNYQEENSKTIIYITETNTFIIIRLFT